ncbi:Zn-ribbon domain-containing protein [Haloarcula sp. S1CR25-12]|uniref:Zn-ribbon domain-containing protein n=1 Tax=Haloarcula saliterrae TaxID=2950534 RepID=A0ABU2FD78_9EURY|nr:Zn-ribbon containing protein [Haloarcula sp. S1CR25-12]MDS0260218.1 Zn-ribbon domain-containing protein [Haloarcula sp. S1CR25-12]
MPHQCTNCGRGFDDGSKEMLSGCPNCGGNKFQFQPADTSSPPDPEAEPPEPPEPPGANSTVAKTVGKTAATVRDIVGGSDKPSVGAEPDDAVGAGPTDTVSAGPTDTEDAAQASARGEVVSPDELPDHTGEGDHQFQPVGTEAEATTADDSGDRPDLQELREELNNQFESIKVLEPGQYELNLMELYDREEYIVALQEDGRYSIQVPETIRE